MGYIEFKKKDGPGAASLTLTSNGKKLEFQASVRTDKAGAVFIAEPYFRFIEADEVDEFIDAIRELRDASLPQGSTNPSVPFKKGDKVRRKNHVGTVRTVEAYHPDSNRLWLIGSNGPLTYENATNNWEVVPPFFEEGKTYRHSCGNTFKVETVRGEGDQQIAFGLVNEGRSTEFWETRGTSDVKDWEEIK